MSCSMLVSLVAAQLRLLKHVGDRCKSRFDLLSLTLEHGSPHLEGTKPRCAGAKQMGGHEIRGPATIVAALRFSLRQTRILQSNYLHATPLLYTTSCSRPQLSHADSKGSEDPFWTLHQHAIAHGQALTHANSLTIIRD